MAKQDPLLTVRLPEHVILEFAAAAKMELKDSSELLRKYVVEVIEAAKKKDYVLFNTKLSEALTDREKRQKITKSPINSRASSAPKDSGYLMSTGKGTAPDEQELRNSQSDIKTARQVARSIERKRGRKK